MQAHRLISNLEKTRQIHLKLCTLGESQVSGILRMPYAAKKSYTSVFCVSLRPAASMRAKNTGSLPSTVPLWLLVMLWMLEIVQVVRRRRGAVKSWVPQ